jgi:rod shape-determining protein MreD
VPFLIVFYFFVIGVAALLAQMILPVIFPILGVIGFNSALIPLVVIYASLELGDERAPILAGVLGLFLDLTSSDRFGTSALILGSLSALVMTQAQRPESHTWLVRLTLVLVGTFAFFVLDYIFILAEAARWTWPVWSKITFGSLLNLFLAPGFFWLAGLLPRFLGWKPAYELNDRYYAR